MDSAAVGSIAGNAAEGMAGAVGLSEGTARSIGSGVRAGAATWADAVKAADSLTAENEYYLGRAVAANIAARYPVYTRDPAMTVYLNKICSALVINSPRPDIYAGYHVAILDTMEINAFATPGGHIFVTRGLLGCAANEDALASVIAHEIAHIQLRHALMSIRNARYINAAVSGVLAGLGEGLGGSVKELTGVMGDSVNEIITTMVSNGYAKDQELEADAQALALLAAAGYQPAAILDMLAALEQVQQGRPGFSKTHPPPAERISGVNKHLARYRISDTRSYRVRRFAVAVPR
jgi:predicted Zn-dependent protease